MDDHLRHPGDRLGDDVLEARVDGRGHRHRVAVAGEPGGHPDDVGLDRLGLGLIRDELGAQCHLNSPRSNASTDPRQRIAGQQVHHPPAAERRLDQHHPGRLRPDLRNLRRRLAPGDRAQRVERRLGGRRGRRRRPSRPRWRRTSDRSRAARRRPATSGTHRDLGLGDRDPDAGGAGELVEDRRDPAAGRVAHRPQLRARRRRAARRRPATASGCRTRPRRRARARRGRA